MLERPACPTHARTPHADQPANPLTLKPFNLVPRPEDRAGDAVAIAKLQLGFHLVTDSLSVTAAWMEAAARWRMDRTWHIPFKDHPLLHAIRVRDGNCR